MNDNESYQARLREQAVLIQRIKRMADRFQQLVAYMQVCCGAQPKCMGSHCCRNFINEER